MASNITLSAGVRQNLLSLQNTADLMSQTQYRLATGKKVNSALDNPTNFFTSQSLQSRAADMAALLDNMNTGIKTLEAADNGLTAITKTIESMQSTMRQARQDKSFKTGTYALNIPTAPAGNEMLTFSGGALGLSSKQISLSKPAGSASAATISGTTPYPPAGIDFQTVAATPAQISANAFGSLDLSEAGSAGTAATSNAGAFAAPLDLSGGNTLSFNITVNGVGPTAIALDVNSLPAAGNDAAVTGTELAAMINAEYGSTIVTYDGVDGRLEFTSPTSTAIQPSIVIDTVAGTPAAITASGLANDNVTGVQGVQADTLSFDITVDGVGPTSITVDSSIAAANDGNVTPQELADEINDQLNTALSTTNVDYASVVGGELVFTSPTTGAASNLTIANVATTGNATTAGISASGPIAGTPTGAPKTLDFTLTVNGVATPISIAVADVQGAGDGNAVLTASEFAEIVNDQLGFNGASVSPSGEISFTSPTMGAASTIALSGIAAIGVTGFGIVATNDTGTNAGTTIAPRTVDELVVAINNDPDLKGKVRASNDLGKLRIENISTQELEVEGMTNGVIDGGIGTASIEGNDVRANLVKQFNDLRDQLDKLADDASYNGINLLRGDLLKLTFNEIGTSTIEIQARDLDDQERPINSTELALTYAQEPEFDSDTQIDARLESLASALGVIRSQASAFGSNLSIVENRTEFTKAMINTLQTGADALVLADTNEEGANMLALQTRQQLSSTALSLAAQADQAVLRLFG